MVQQVMLVYDISSIQGYNLSSGALLYKHLYVPYPLTWSDMISYKSALVVT